MRIKETKLFEFNELSSESKEKAINSFRGDTSFLDYPWYDSTIEDFIENAKNIGFDIETREIEFDLNRGSRFGINPDGISMNDDWIKNKLKLKNKPWVDIEFKVKNVGSWHEEFPRMEWKNSNDNCEGWYIVHIDNSQSNTKIKSLVDKCISDLVSLCSDCYDKLSEEYIYLCSDESIINNIEANNYEFTEDGKIS